MEYCINGCRTLTGPFSYHQWSCTAFRAQLMPCVIAACGTIRTEKGPEEKTFRQWQTPFIYAILTHRKSRKSMEGGKK